RDGEDRDKVLGKADRVIEELVANNENSYEAYLARIAYRKQYHPDIDLSRDAIKARELAARNPEVLLVSAEVARSKSELDRARDFLRQGIDANAQDQRFYRILADIEIADRKPAAAIDWLTKGLAALPRGHDLRWTLTELYIDAGERGKAQEQVNY